MTERRCILSDEGCRTFPSIIRRRARIVGESRDKTCWRVIWDGLKAPDGLHKSYITVLE